MKKIYKILLCGVLVIVLTGCGNNKNYIFKDPQLFSVTSNGNESPHIYYELPDRYIYTHDMIDSIKFTYNNETKELSEWFNENENFLDIFLDEIERISPEVLINSYDGGSKEYHDGNIGIVFCNTYDDNINIVIGKNLDYKFASCGWGKKILVTEKSDNDKVINIIDKSKYYGEEVNVGCTDEPKTFYEDNKYKYNFGCRGIVVIYESGYQESAEDAFINGSITFEDLDKYNIKYNKIKK